MSILLPASSARLNACASVFSTLASSSENTLPDTVAGSESSSTLNCPSSLVQAGSSIAARHRRSSWRHSRGCRPD